MIFSGRCVRWVFFLIILLPPGTTRTDTLFPYTTLCRSAAHQVNTVFSPYPHSMPAPANFRLLTEAERHASLQQSLTHWKADQDIWVYGYGSLIWRPEFEFTEKRDALLHGYHRVLCLWSRVNRGTPDQPGLVFGLDAGGSCRGMAYRIPARNVPTTMEALWRREMPSGAYLPKWLSCRTDEGLVTALVFTMNRNTEDRKSTRLNSSHSCASRIPSLA